MDAGTAAADIGVIPGSAGTRLAERFISSQDQTGNAVHAIQGRSACPGRLPAGIKADILMRRRYPADPVIIDSREIVIVILTDV